MKALYGCEDMPIYNIQTPTVLHLCLGPINAHLMVLRFQNHSYLKGRLEVKQCQLLYW